MRTVFVGAGEFSWHMLEECLRNGVEVGAVFSVHPRHRGGIWDYRDLSELTMDHHIPHFRVRELASEANVGRMKWLAPELILVMGFDRYIPPAVLQIPRMGVIGSHASPLPVDRGRNPIPWSILAGEETGGLSFYYLTPGYDDGDVVLSRSWGISVEDSSASLYRRMISTGREMVRELVGRLKTATLTRRPQDPGQATQVPKGDLSRVEIGWQESARQCYDKVRAVTHPYPGAFTHVKGRKVAVWKGFLSYEGREAGPGEVVGVYEKGVEVACGAGSMILQIVQIGDGPEEAARRAFDRLGVEVGDRLGGKGSGTGSGEEVSLHAGER